MDIWYMDTVDSIFLHKCAGIYWPQVIPAKSYHLPGPVRWSKRSISGSFATPKHQRLWEYRTTCTLCSLYLPWPWNSVQSSTSSDQTGATGGVYHSAESLAWKNPSVTYHQRVKWALVYPTLTVINFNFQTTSAHKHCVKVRSNTDVTQHSIYSSPYTASLPTPLLNAAQDCLVPSRNRMSSKGRPS